MSQESIKALLARELPGIDLPNSIITPVTYDEATEPSQHVQDVVTELNIQWLLTGTYSFDKLKESCPILLHMGPEQLQELFDEVNKILEDKRGLPHFDVTFKTTKVLDPRFVAACNLIMDVSDKRSVSAKLKDVGMTTKSWNHFLRVKANREFYEALMDRMMDFDTYQESKLALARNVSNGDLPSIKYYHEFAGKFVASKDFDPRIMVYLMTAVLEIITKHVDGNTARLIADELETVAIKELGMGI